MQPRATCPPLLRNTVSTARHAWTVLDTAFGNGRDFLAYCSTWRSDAQRSHMLHYVGLLQTQHQTAWEPELAALLEDMGPGFQRFVLDEGRISLTLCIGSTNTMLTEQRMQADWVTLNTQTTYWDLWTLKALARCCRRGAVVHITGEAPLAQLAWKEAGFTSFVEPNQGLNRLRFDPPWNVLKRGSPLKESPLGPDSCVVIGAGLAGASVAHALAVRGWQVTVLDSHASPAGGASGLPVGLVGPHVTADDSTRSRLSRNGSRLMLQYAANLLCPGLQWERTGVLERRPEGDLWHQHAGWIQPESLVLGWLKHTNIRFHGNACVSTLQRKNSEWELLDSQGGPLAQARHVVFANAMGCQNLLASLSPDLLRQLAQLQALHGTLSSGKAVASAFTDSPINGNGSYVANIPTHAGARWFAGATFETDAIRLADVQAQHLANHERLRQLLPNVGLVLEKAFVSGKVTAWTGTRCVSHDRMPLAGPLETHHAPTLWINAAMGARGLSFSALCAHWVVAQMCDEPWPVEASLAQGLNVQRQQRKRA